MAGKRKNETNDPLAVRILRRSDQAVVGALVAVSLVAMIGYWFTQGGWQGRLIEIEQEVPRTARFEVDINTADWPELAQLPGIGETLARRIVESRQDAGLFIDHEDLRRVRGIGPRTLERISPYLQPMPSSADVAGPSVPRERQMKN